MAQPEERKLMLAQLAVCMQTIRERERACWEAWAEYEVLLLKANGKFEIGLPDLGRATHQPTVTVANQIKTYRRRHNQERSKGAQNPG